MTARFLAFVVSLLLVLGAQAVTTVSYLCGMDGQVHQSSCCCHEDEAKTASGPSVERSMGCCEARFSNSASDAPAILQEEQTASTLSLAAHAEVPLVVDEPTRPTSRDASWPGSARAPPRASGLPLFVLHCRYLI